jgi:hypothetical protein
MAAGSGACANAAEVSAMEYSPPESPPEFHPSTVGLPLVGVSRPVGVREKIVLPLCFGSFASEVIARY